MADGEKQASTREQGALVLLGRVSDLAHFEACADVPARFYTRFDGVLEETASVEDEQGLDHLLATHESVGLDATLLMPRRDDGPHEARYRQNLAQKLALRRVLCLVVLRTLEYRNTLLKVAFLREGDTGGGEVRCNPNSDRLSDWVGHVEGAGFECRIDLVPASGVASLYVGPGRGLVPLVEAQDRDDGDLVAWMDFQREGDGLRSGPFRIELAQRDMATMEEVLRDRARRQEEHGIQEVRKAWLAAVEGMQEDTRSRTQLEMAVIATRKLEATDRELISSVVNLGGSDTKAASAFLPKVRVWLMTERLRVAENSQTLVYARHVWPDALSLLITRLCLAGEKDRKTGMFAWRGIAFGPKFDADKLEKIRSAAAQEILTETTEDKSPPHIDLAGPFRLLAKEWSVRRESATGPDWDEGDAASLVRTELSEGKWVDDHRVAGNDLAVRRANVSRNHMKVLEDGTLQVAKDGDPERYFSVAYWTRIHKSPGVLRAFSEAREFRTQRALVERLVEHLGIWNKEVLEARREVARQRETVLQHAEELDKARELHLGIGWRLLIGSAVATYTGFLALSLLRVLTNFSAGTWGAGLTIVLCGLFGGWAGAVLPMWFERQQGLGAARSLRSKVEGVDHAHRVAVGRTHVLFVDADHMRQEARVAAVQRRTALLANRAWTVVRHTLESLRQEVARKKLLSNPGETSKEVDALAIEDQREWRLAAIVRPEASLPEDLESVQVWKKARDEIAKDFLKEWKAELDTADPFHTGFLQTKVLVRLVRRLSAKVSESLESELLKLGEKQIWDAEDRSKVKTDAPIKTEDWARAIIKSLGRDASMHALLSALDEGAGVRPPGSYRFFLLNSHLTREVHAAVKADKHINTDPQFTEVLPLSIFGLVFHEVGVELDADGKVRLVPDEGAKPEDQDAASKGAGT